MEYIKSAKKQFLAYKSLAGKAIAQMEDTQLFWQPNEESNSVAIIVKHMWGNMMSRWTDFLTTDGEKPWRERDSEFVNDWNNRETLMNKWEEGWTCLFNALDSITDNDLEKMIHIRNEGLSVLDAINRQLTHYSSHVGQIIYIAKMCKNKEWESLSIPRNQSNEYRFKKFSPK